MWVTSLALLILASWFIPLTAALWSQLDQWLFRMLNDGLRASPVAQIFWALANLKICDLLGALFIIAFSLIFVFEAKDQKRRERLAQFFYYLIWFEVGMLFVKELFFQLLLGINFLRESPSLISLNPVFLSEACPWLKIKDSSHWCFPSDHAFIVFQWAAFIWAFAGARLGLIASFSSIFFVLPRLVAGAHWASDALVGSLVLALAFVAVACFTPLYTFSMAYLERLSNSIFNLFTRECSYDQKIEKCPL